MSELFSYLLASLLLILAWYILYKATREAVKSTKRSTATYKYIMGITRFIFLAIIASMIHISASNARKGNETAREKARRIICAGNLKQIGMALLTYSEANEGLFPVSLEVLWQTKTRYLDYGKVYLCSSAESSLNKPNSDYIYIGSGLKNDIVDLSVVPLAYDNQDNHPAKAWINVLFADGRVQGGKPSDKWPPSTELNSNKNHHNKSLNSELR